MFVELRSLHYSKDISKVSKFMSARTPVTFPVLDISLAKTDRDQKKYVRIIQKKVGKGRTRTIKIEG